MTSFKTANDYRLERQAKLDAEGGSAFPFANDEDKNYNWISRGMTLREWLAGQALAGIMAEGLYAPSRAAAHAVEAADETLKALRGSK